MKEDAVSDKTIQTSGDHLVEKSVRVLPPLTEKQAQCLHFIHDYFLKHRFYPTQREVAEAMHLQSSTAETYLEPLRRKGYIHRRAKKQRRNIRLTPIARQKLQLEETA